MNKISHKHEPRYQISKIQANLKEMKDEVEGFLKKHSKEKVPPILRARHYLLVDTINHLGNTKAIESPQKLIKDLSSEAIASFTQIEKMSQVNQMLQERKSRNRIIKEKRGKSMTNSISTVEQPEVSCLLPNICNLKLNRDQSYNLNMVNRRPQPFEKEFHSTLTHQYRDTPQFSDKKYQSIDLSQQTILLQQLEEETKKVNKRDRRHWLHRSVGKGESKKGQLSTSELLTPQSKEKSVEDNRHYLQQNPHASEPKQQNNVNSSSDSYNREHIIDRKKLHSQFLKKTSYKLTTSTKFNEAHGSVDRSFQKKGINIRKNEPYTFEPWEDEFNNREQSFYVFDSPLD